LIEAVTFDFWDTLVSEGDGIDAEEEGSIRAGQRRRWSEILEEAGTPVDDLAIERAFDRNWEVFHERWRSNVQHGPPEATPVICDLLGVDPTAEVRSALVESFAEAGRQAPLRLANSVEPTLRSLKEAGLRIGIICDVGMTSSPTLRERLDAFGVLELFDHWSFSDEVGCFKPWPGIFRHALAGLGVREPATVAHVGDNRRTDVAGAHAMGMIAVRYTGFWDDPSASGDEADRVLDDHASIPAALGIV
jgi:FMN phosphatase YigB (HAD superfamily)